MDDLFCRKQEQLRKQMSTAKAKGVLEKVAYHWGVSLETVEQEIEKAIREARTNPKTREFWDKIPCRGEYPTPEELLSYLAESAQRPSPGQY